MTVRGAGRTGNAVLLALSLVAAGCSSYTIKSDAVLPGVAPRPQPLRVAVAVPDLSDPAFAGLGYAATSTLHVLYLDFIATLERSGLFAKVEQVAFSASRNPRVGSADLLATLLHRPELPGTNPRRVQQVLVAASLFKLAPIIDAHETYSVTAELSVVRPGGAGSARRYTAAGMATLVSKIYAPREEAVRDALVAAGRAANARIVEQLAGDAFFSEVTTTPRR